MAFEGDRVVNLTYCHNDLPRHEEPFTLPDESVRPIAVSWRVAFQCSSLYVHRRRVHASDEGGGLQVETWRNSVNRCHNIDPRAVATAEEQGPSSGLGTSVVSSLNAGRRLISAKGPMEAVVR